MIPGSGTRLSQEQGAALISPARCVLTDRICVRLAQTDVCDSVQVLTSRTPDVNASVWFIF
jgi:hypothetical protein